MKSALFVQANVAVNMGVSAGGGHGGGAHVPQNFYGRAEIHLSLGENIKISEKLWYVRKIFYMFAKIMGY
jgi:hypothetical protein